MIICAHCGHKHTNAADRWACDAQYGRRTYPAGVRAPVCCCLLCGTTEPLDELLEHFWFCHRQEATPDGRLVRYVEDVPDNARL